MAGKRHDAPATVPEEIPGTEWSDNEGGGVATAEGPPEGTHENEHVLPDSEEPEEVLNLHNAIGKVVAKIRWHEEQIEDHNEDIKGHRTQIEELRVSLRRQVGPLIGQTFDVPSENRRPTGSLIEECLKAAGKPLDTDEIKRFLEANGNTTNPSVELSRMVKRGTIERAGRGMYQLKKKTWRNKMM